MRELQGGGVGESLVRAQVDHIGEVRLGIVSANIYISSEFDVVEDGIRGVGDANRKGCFARGLIEIDSSLHGVGCFLKAFLGRIDRIGRISGVGRIGGVFRTGSVGILRVLGAIRAFGAFVVVSTFGNFFGVFISSRRSGGLFYFISSGFVFRICCVNLISSRVSRIRRSSRLSRGVCRDSRYFGSSRRLSCS